MQCTERQSSWHHPLKRINTYIIFRTDPTQQPPEENRTALFLKIFHQIHIFTSPTLYQKNRYFRLYAFCPYLYGKYRSNKDRKPTVGADNGNTCNPGPAETEKPEIKFWRCSHLSLSLQKIGCASENREQVPVFSRLSLSLHSTGNPLRQNPAKSILHPAFIVFVHNNRLKSDGLP